MSNWNPVYTPSYESDFYRPSTNIQYTPCLEEALSRCNVPGTETVIFHQDKPVFYRIKVDRDGKKYWQEFAYDAVKPVEEPKPVSSADLTDIVERIRRIEDYVFQTSEVPNENSNG